MGVKNIKNKESLISVFFAIFCLISLIYFNNCNIKRDPFNSYYDKTSFSNILNQKEKLCIISCSVDPVIYDSFGQKFDISPGFMLGEKTLKRNSPQFQASLKKELSKITESLSSKHFEHIKSNFSNRFQIVGPKDYDEVKTDIADKQNIITTINENSAQFGLIMHNQFGAKWQSDNTGIDSYYFQFVTIIYNQEGKMVWIFCGKGSQDFKIDISLRGLAEGFSGSVSAETMIKGFKHIYTQYPRFLLHLIEDDVMGKEHRTKISDYIKFKKFSEYFSVYNCINDRVLPIFPKPKLIVEE